MSNNNNFNFDENTMNNIKNMVDNGNISDAISQISPDMIQNFSKMLQNNSNNNTSKLAFADAYSKYKDKPKIYLFLNLFSTDLSKLLIQGCNYTKYKL